MALAQSLQTAQRVCPIKPIYDSLSDEDKAVFDKEIEKNISVNSMLLALQKEGYQTSWTPLNRHMKKVCRCYR